MKRFMVVVNHKYIVTVEAETNGGAEHRILDNIRHSQSVQSFDIAEKETDTELFRDFFNTCETVSLEELKRKDREAMKAEHIHLNDLFDVITGLKGEIYECKQQIEGLEFHIKYAEEEIATVTQQRKEFARKYRLDDKYFSESQLEAILSEGNASTEAVA